jgi:outer membrane protein W
MRSTRGFAAAAATAGVIGLLFFSPAAAAQGGYEAGKGSWTVRAFGAWLDTDEFRFESGPAIDPFPPILDFTFTLGDGSGAGLSLEYRATRRVGVEALAIRADLEGEFRVTLFNPPIPEQVVTDDVETDLYSLGVNFHLTPGRRFDVYAGPVVAYVQYDDFKASVDLGFGSPGTFEARFTDDTAYGIALGADYPLGRSGRWAVSGAVRQLWYDSGDDEEDSVEVGLDPLIATAGVAYRFGG